MTDSSDTNEQQRTILKRLGEVSGLFNIVLLAAIILLPFAKPIFEPIFGFHRDKIEQDYGIRRNSERLDRIEKLLDEQFPRRPK